VYNNGNELSAETYGSISKTFSYDYYGRRTTKALQDHRAYYGYAYADRMKMMTSLTRSDFPGEIAAQDFTYDGQGVVDGPNVYAYTGGNPIGRVDLEGQRFECITVPTGPRCPRGYDHNWKSDECPPVQYCCRKLKRDCQDICDDQYNEELYDCARSRDPGRCTADAYNRYRECLAECGITPPPRLPRPR